MKVFIAVIAAIACFATVDSLICTKCTVGILGFCIGSSNETCANDNSMVCYRSKAEFPSVSSFKGFVTQGCGNNTCGINSTILISNGSLPILGLNYTVTTSCCSTDKCSPVDTSGASATAASLSVLSVAALGAVFGSFM